MDIIDSLGGLEDVIKPMEESLRIHEMRPFDIEPNYYQDLMKSKYFQENTRQTGLARQSQSR